MEPIGGTGMLGAVVAQLATPAAAAPSEADASQFAQMVQQPDAPIQAGAPAATGTALALTPGDSILNGMNALGTDFKDAWAAMQQALARPQGEMTVAEMLRLQLHMVQLSVQVEMVGKTISKATQNLDQLAKLQ